MTNETRDGTLQEELKREWCAGFEVVPIDDHTFTLVTPFIMQDGDGFSLVVERSPSGWRLTDRGATASRVFTTTDATAARERRFQLAAQAFGVNLDRWSLSLELPGPPEIYDVAHFLKALSAAAGSPQLETAEDREEHYSVRLREFVTSRLPAEVRRATSWAPPEDLGRGLYKVDLRLDPPHRSPLLIFTVGTAMKAERAVGTALRLKEWAVEGDRVVAVKPSVPSPSVYRLQDAVGEDRVARLDLASDITTSGSLRRLGVPLTE
jgi:hypothetical protein